MGYGKAKKNYAMALKKKKSYAIRKVSQDVIGKKTRMKRSAWNYGKATDSKGDVVGDDISSDKEIRINKLFKKNKNLYTRRVVKGRSVTGEPEKRTYTKVGNKRIKSKKKKISERNLKRSFEKTKKKVERSRRGIVDRNYSIAVKSEKKFKPHTMYDPKTGKGVSVNKVEDHLKLKKKGFSHSKKNYSLYVNINKRRAKGISRSKANSTVSKKSYDNMKKGFK